FVRLHLRTTAVTDPLMPVKAGRPAWHNRIQTRRYLRRQIERRQLAPRSASVELSEGRGRGAKFALPLGAVGPEAMQHQPRALIGETLRHCGMTAAISRMPT